MPLISWIYQYIYNKKTDKIRKNWDIIFKYMNNAFNFVDL